MMTDDQSLFFSFFALWTQLPGMENKAESLQIMHGGLMATLDVSALQRPKV
jgi:hypothetical protein